MPTISKEDYLKTIYNIKKSGDEKVSTYDLAAKLEISNAATSEMAKKLGEQGLIVYEKYKGVDLTNDGQKIALGIVRRHRLWELFLIQTLGLSWGEVHDEAERLEHHTSDFLLNRIDKFLNYPEFDPHGDPIPDKNGEMPELPECISLKDTSVGKKYKVIRVDHQSNEVMEYFSQLGIELYKEIEVVNKLSFDNSIFIRINDKVHTFSERVADKLSVVPIKED